MRPPMPLEPEELEPEELDPEELDRGVPVGRSIEGF